MKKVTNISEAVAEAKRTKIDHLLAMTREVLESDSQFSEILTTNILCWKETVDNERRVRALELKMGIVPAARIVKK